MCFLMASCVCLCMCSHTNQPRYNCQKETRGLNSPLGFKSFVSVTQCCSETHFQVGLIQRWKKVEHWLLWKLEYKLTKTIQSHKLGSHTFPLNAQADVSCSSGGLQAGAHSGPLCGCTTETNPSARSGARVRKMGSRPGQACVLLSPKACCHLVLDLKFLMAKSRSWGQLWICYEDCQWLGNQGWCLQGQWVRFRAKGGCLGRERGRPFYSRLEEPCSIPQLRGLL